jgi:hypothetical protein
MKQFMESWEVKVRPNTFSSLLVCWLMTCSQVPY